LKEIEIGLHPASERVFKLSISTVKQIIRRNTIDNLAENLFLGDLSLFSQIFWDLELKMFISFPFEIPYRN